MAINWDFIRAVMASVANTAIIPLQDLLGHGTEARMNLPNTTSGTGLAFCRRCSDGGARRSPEESHDVVRP